jgi:outer membrane protein OmpA-like peptidoglycan-associated protein
MTKRSTLLLTLFFFIGAAVLHAQEEEASGTDYGTPRDMIEFGVHGGYLFVGGDVPQEPGYGVGLHIRKSLDYVFSIRVDGFYGSARGEENQLNDENYHKFETTYISGTAFGVISANNLKWNKSTRKMNLYALIGGGGAMFRPRVNLSPRTEDLNDPDFSDILPHLATGAGIAFRISDRMNIGLEHQIFFPLGSLGDEIDGQTVQSGNSGNRIVSRDILNYTSLRLNFNIGNPTKSSLPLYWVNPMENVMNELDNIKKNQSAALQDSDGDGVIDAIDQEPNTPPDVPVDTKGRTLDSDRDGVADYKDREPYFQPRPGERVNEEGVVVNPTSVPGGGVSEDRVREIISEELQNYQLRQNESNGANGGGQMTEWFLPMIHFGTDSDRIKYADYGTLASIARMMKGNPQLRIVVTGFADASAPESYNDELSYLRAKSVVDHLVNNHGIGRGRFVIQWKGETELLVPSGNSYMNRRVEFRVAQPDDVEMDPPSGIEKEDNDGF